MQLKETQIQSNIIEILKDITQEWGIDVDDINSGTKLVEDLSFVSVDIIHLVVSIEEHFKQKLGFNELLMQDGKYVDDLSIDKLASFVSRKLN
ncbi:MAG: acyl carrier protein [Tolypothrix sp. T3-bin4]|nr:acyl carrier protein [Tolypothrix sp. T3-bin4]